MVQYLYLASNFDVGVCCGVSLNVQGPQLSIWSSFHQLKNTFKNTFDFPYRIISPVLIWRSMKIIVLIIMVCRALTSRWNCSDVLHMFWSNMTLFCGSNKSERWLGFEGSDRAVINTGLVGFVWCLERLAKQKQLFNVCGEFFTHLVERVETPLSFLLKNDSGLRKKLKKC